MANRPGKPKAGTTLADRFWSNVDKHGPLPDQSNQHYAGLGSCWQWLGAPKNDGYGQIRVAGTMARAHRVAFELVKGAIKMNLMHKCDNRLCVNPDHLVEGSYSDNTRDMIRKDRHGAHMRKRAA